MWSEYISEKSYNDFLESFFNSMTEGFAHHELICNEKGNPVDYKFLEVNDAFTKITGLCKENLVGKRVTEILPDTEQYWIDTYGKVALTGEPVNYENYSKALDKHFKVSAFSPKKGQFSTFFLDITDLKKASEAMKKHQALFDNAQDIILYSRTDGSIVDVNINGLLKYGYSLKELTKLNIQDIRDKSMTLSFEEQMAQSDENGITFEGVHVKKDGISFPVEVSVKGVLIDKYILRIHIIRDISERKAAEEKITYLANYDSLTDIPNRCFLMNQLNSTLENAGRGNFKIALMMFDIDKFKGINDTFGHNCGDIVLKEIARIVQSSLRKVDFLARLGGDEFVIIQPYINGVEDCSVLARRILDKLKTPINYKNVELEISLSIGISIYPDHSMDLDNLMSLADKAMYKTKQSRGGSFEIYSTNKNL